MPFSPAVDNLAPMWEKASHWKNRWEFALRNTLKWRRTGYQEPWESKVGIFDHRPDAPQLEADAKRLVQRYQLARFQEESSRVSYLETLTCLAALEVLLDGVALPVATRWLDVGCKNWAYVFGLAAYLAAQEVQDSQLVGLELDAYRPYADFHTRYDYALAYCRDLPQARYEVGDVMAHHARYEVVSCFLPFVFAEPCLKWGLPLDYFQPEAFLSHLLGLVQPGGVLLVVNQGEAEAQEQARLFEQVLPRYTGACLVPRGSLPPAFFDSRHTRYGFTVQLGPENPS